MVISGFRRYGRLDDANCEPALHFTKFVQRFFRPRVHQIQKHNSVGDIMRRSLGTWRLKFPNKKIGHEVTAGGALSDEQVRQQCHCVVGVQSLWNL